jgi:hypothetical protein
MPEPPESPPPPPATERVWMILAVAAPVIIAVGGIGVIVGIVRSQPVGAILVNVMVMVVGAILRLVLRWR